MKNPIRTLKRPVLRAIMVPNGDGSFNVRSLTPNQPKSLQKLDIRSHLRKIGWVEGRWTKEGSVMICRATKAPSEALAA